MSSKKKILLLKDVYNLGRSGDLSVVARGYGNYLICKGDALLADKASIRRQAKLKEARALRAAKDLELSNELTEKLSSVTLSIPVKVDQDGHMYGSVHAHDLSKLLEDSGIVIDKKRLCMKPIKEIGKYEIKVKLYEGVEGFFNVEIVPESKLEGVSAESAE